MEEGSRSSERSIILKDPGTVEVLASNGEKTSSRQKRLSGWRVGILYGAATAFVVLLINIVTLAYASTRKNLPIDHYYDGPINIEVVQEPVNPEGRKTLYGGDCETVRKLNVSIHLLINILSTVLLVLAITPCSA